MNTINSVRNYLQRYILPSITGRGMGVGLLMLTLCFMTSCSDNDLADLNTDKTKATLIDPNAQLTTAQLQVYGDFQIMDTYRNYITGFTQHFSGGWNVVNFAGSNNYDDTMYSLWYRFYGVGIKNLVDGIYNSTEKPNLNAALRIQRVYMMSILTDAYGDVPYSEAGLGYLEGKATPKYDRQEDIYNDFFTELEACVNQLGTGTDRITGDVTNLGGDIAAWKKFANSLRMRFAMRISDKSPAKAREEFEKAVNADGGYIDSPDYDAYVKHIDVPFTLYDGAKEYDFRANALGETHYGQSYESPGMICASFFRLMRDNNDPRLYRICRHYDNLKRSQVKPDEWNIDLTDEYLDYLSRKNPNVEPSQSEIPCEVGCTWYQPWPETELPVSEMPTLVKLQQEYPDAGFGKSNDHIRLMYPWLSIEFEMPDRPGYFISSAEVHFLLAEALSKNWTVPGSMKGHFEAGIRESMQMLNTHYLSNSLKISDAEISDYINNIEHKYSLDDHPREVINTQAYILHLMNPSEAWANLRRADYPVLKDRRTIEKWSSQFKYPDEDLSTPDRLGYPTEEKDYNGDNWREALDRMDGTDSWHNRVWWDKDHGHFE